MTITVNGKTESFNIGCRSFISIAELLSIFGVVTDTQSAVHVNDTVIDPADYTVGIVKSGDCFKFESKSIR